MKERRLVLTIVFVLGLLLILWLFRTTTKRYAPESQSGTNPQLSESNITGNGTTDVYPILAGTNIASSNTISEMRPGEIPRNQTMAYPDNAFDDWRTPINFYGRVLNETSGPVEGATINFGWTDTSFDGYSRASTISDGSGFFTLEGRTGKHLSVSVNKAGYYTSKSNRTSYFYAGETENFIPNLNKPVVFFLKKAGKAADLITSKNGVRQDLALRLFRDGNPTTLSFFEKKASANGELTISQIKPSHELLSQVGEWSFSLEIPTGGFVESTEEFPFLAPLGDYQPRINLHFKKSDANWTMHINKSYFIIFGEPRKYGWLRVKTDVSLETVFIQYAINPSGARNLEPRK